MEEPKACGETGATRAALGICGIEAKVEADQGAFGDDSSLK